MRVLHVISGIRPAAGGTTFALAGLTKAQADAGLDVATFSTFLKGDDAQGLELFDPRVTMHRLGPATNPMSRHPDLPARVQRAVEQADIVHIHGLWEMSQPTAAEAAWRQGKPYLITPHGMLEPWSMGQTFAKALKKRIYLWLKLRRWLNRASAMHATTELEQTNLKRLGLKSPTLVESNGLDLAEFRDLPAGGFLRQRHPEIGDRPILLFLARINRKKGVDVLMRAFVKAKQSAGDSPMRDAVLVLAGPNTDGYLAEMMQIAKAGGVADDILATGLLDKDERVAALVDADLFVLSSYNENYGIAVIESMAAGTPVLISDQVQCHPEVTAADAGDVLPVDSDAFAEKMIQRLILPKELTAAGMRGRAHALASLGWGAVATRWVKHYTKMVATVSKKAVREGGASD